MNSVSKTTLVGRDARTAEGHETFVLLVMRHERDLVRTARRLCGGNEDRAQDFAQEALVRAYQACLSGRFREEASPRAWLQRIVTNLYINDYNRRRRWEAECDPDAPSVRKRLNELAQRAALTEAPAARLMAATLDEAPERALASLPERLRRCVILVDMEGLEYAQAAQALGIPVGTVRSRLSRARLILSGLLEDYARSHGLLAR